MKKTSRMLLLGRPGSDLRMFCTRMSTRNGRVRRQIGITTLVDIACKIGGNPIYRLTRACVVHARSGARDEPAH
jgi:hypothetical protein